ncbi:MAG: hypothetical protein ACI3VN_07640 [Candidatus Onthomonas sp.]
MKESASVVSVRPRLLEKIYPWENQPVLACQLSLPQITGPGRGPGRIDRYYRHLERRLLAWLSARYAQVCCLAEEALAASQPIPQSRVDVSYQVVFQDKERLSLLWTLDTDGACRQHADLWSLPDGAPLDCRRLLSAKLARRARGKTLLLTEQGVCALENGQWMPLWSPSA